MFEASELLQSYIQGVRKELSSARNSNFTSGRSNSDRPISKNIFCGLNERILINMSVWESIEALHEFSYRGHHAGLLRDRGKWFETSSTRLALWWVAAGALPSVDDAKRKLELLEANGPTLEAFTFRQHFPPPR